MSSYVENSQTRHGCSVTILTVLSGASYLMVLILTNCQINGIVRIIQIPTWDHVIFLKRRKRKLNSHMLKHKRNACEYFFQCIFLGGKGGRRPVASVEFFGFENIKLFKLHPKPELDQTIQVSKCATLRFVFGGNLLLWSSSSRIFEWCLSARSEPFSCVICLVATKFVLLSIFTLLELVCPNICLKIAAQEYKNSTSSLCVSLIITNPDYLTCWG